MLKKLFRYEWKSISQLLFVMHGMLLVFAVITRIFYVCAGGFENGSAALNTTADVMIVLLTILLFMAIGGIAFFTYVYIAYRFYKSVFTDQGYLTNTLPVTPVQIVLSKGIAGILWVAIDTLVLIIAMMILYLNVSDLPDLASSFLEFFRNLGSQHAFFWLTMLAIVLSPFVMVLQMYFSVAVGNLFSGHKVLGAIGTFFGIFLIQQIGEIILVIATGWRIASKPDIRDASDIFSAMNLTIIISLIFTAACIAAFWFGTQHIMTRKLNLQ